jgi:FAD/FMN-containing dehydrogenase
MSPEPLPIGSDGFYHPSSEPELVALVRWAYCDGLQLRVRGAAHSVSHAIYTDPLDVITNGVGQQSPPRGSKVNIMLDNYRSWRVVDEANRRVEVQAGIHLGEDPSDPTKGATLRTSLLWQLWHVHGWTLSDTGGISHQTVSGFTATGSSGGSVVHSANENLYAFRIIDGTGAVHVITRGVDPCFYALSPNLGLLGVVSTITLECDKAFNIAGQEAIFTPEESDVDVFGDGTATKPSLASFLRETEYARLLWWPQRGAQRIQIWQAQRIPPEPGFRPRRYEEFTADPALAELEASLIYTILGNLDDLSPTRGQLKKTFDYLTADLRAALSRRGRFGALAACVLRGGLGLAVDVAVTLIAPFAPLVKRLLPWLFPRLLDRFVKLDSGQAGMHRGEPQSFHDWAWRGLPMDDQADDTLVPTEFSEMWIPLGRAGEAVRRLRDYFAEPDSAVGSYARTGLYAFEMYAAQPTEFWLSASHSEPSDAWAQGAFRIDAFWFAHNPGDPDEVFYPQFWNLLREAGVPFRLHWGKFQPRYGSGDRDWVDFFRRQYPRWDDFLALRAKLDPNNIFLTSYWRDRLGLWDAPAPRPGGPAAVGGT